MPVLIDGHNLIGRLSDLSLQDPDDEEKLVLRLISYRAQTGKPVTVVFDPGPVTRLPRKQRRGGIEVVFAPQGSSADAVIIQRVRRSQNPQEWLVVTSDRTLSSAIARLGGRVRSAEAFAAELAASPSKTGHGESRAEAPLSPEEVDAWLQLFSVKE